MTEFGTVQRVYELIIGAWAVFCFLLLLDKAGRAGWIRCTVDSAGRFVKYTVLRCRRRAS